MKKLKNSIAAVIAIAFFIVMFSFIYPTIQSFTPYVERMSLLAHELFGPYIVAFELVSVLLTSAMLGALYVAERGEKR